MTTYTTAEVNTWFQTIDGLPATAPSIPTTDANLYVAQLNASPPTATPAQVQADLENFPGGVPQDLFYRTSVAQFVLREFQAAWGVVPDATQYEAWVARVIADPALENGGMSQALAGTTQFMALYGTTSATEPATAALVTALCQGILGIPPGPGALLNVGLPVWEVLQNFAQSSQFIADTSTAIVGFQNALLAGETPTGSLLNFSPSGPGATFTLTTGVDTNASLGAPASGIPASATVNGVINNNGFVSGSTLNPGDDLLFSGGTLKVVDVLHQPGNELAGVTLNGPFKFVVQEEASTGGNFDFTLIPGETQVTSLNSQEYVSLTGLAAGTVVEMSGAQSNAYIYSGFSDPTTPVTLQFDSGVQGEGIENYDNSAAPTTATLLSTGAANGNVHSDFAEFTDDTFSVSSLTIAASTNLKVELNYDDYASNAALVVKDGTLAAGASPATLVDLLPSSGGIPFKSVDASGLSAGSLQMWGDSDLQTFTGGHGTANELLWDGSSSDFLSTGATAINGGSSVTSITASDMGNTLSAAFIGATNASIFSNWQTLDVTNMYQAGVDQGFATPGQLDTSLLSNNGPIMGLQFTGSDANVETLLNVAPATTILITNPNGGSTTDAGLTLTHSSGGTDSLNVNFVNTDTTASSDQTLNTLTSTGDTSITINANGGGSGSWAYIPTINETDNSLTTVTVTGNEYFYQYGVHTDTGVAAGTATIPSSLTTIDASGTTNGVYILAGDNDTVAGNTITYTGLTIKGGTGAHDFLYDGANSGVITDGSGTGDGVSLGGDTASATVGSGAHDYAYVGYDDQAGTASAQGASVGNSVTFGAAATANISLYQGAELTAAQVTAIGSNGTTAATQTAVHGAAAGMTLDFSNVVGATNNLVLYTPTAGDTTFALTENHAIASLGTTGVVEFSYGGNEYLVAHQSGAALTAGDSVVDLVGIANHNVTLSAGVVTLH